MWIAFDDWRRREGSQTSEQAEPGRVIFTPSLISSFKMPASGYWLTLSSSKGLRCLLINLKDYFFPVSAAASFPSPLKTNAHFHSDAEAESRSEIRELSHQDKSEQPAKKCNLWSAPLLYFISLSPPFVLSAITPLILSFDGAGADATTTASARWENSFSGGHSRRVYQNFWH